MNHTAPHPYCGEEMPEAFVQSSSSLNKNVSQEGCRFHERGEASGREMNLLRIFSYCCRKKAVRAGIVAAV